MGQVTLILNQRSYRVGCNDGDEERLAALAAHLKQKLDRVIGEFGQVGEARLMLLTALLITDELFEARAERDMAASTAAAAAMREIAERARPDKRARSEPSESNGGLSVLSAAGQRGAVADPATDREAG